MTDTIPQSFDESFLHWFRERTEAFWLHHSTTTFEEFAASGVGGGDWQQGTRWLSGLSDAEITAIEQQYHIRFPPDYRLFLQVLHSVDRPCVGARYAEDDTIIPINRPSFYHWFRDTEAIQDAYDWLVEGLLVDVQHNDLWPQSWGSKPDTPEEQQKRVREFVDAAPRLIPIYGHRYLLAEPCAAGNPVLSIYQSDMIIYGVDLRDYLLAEFGDLIGIPTPYGSQLTEENFAAYQQIPFWGDFLS